MTDNDTKKTENGKQQLCDLRAPRITLAKDVVLPEETKIKFDEAIGALKYHKIIYSDWGFGEVDPTGRNMVINLYGPPGTGKTLAAEALSGTLGLPYLHLGISELESKFVGETAKNISEAFSMASREGALLFFDEADTLLGARLSTVTQGIDNEINAMRSTLLVELERFEGIVVFATNFAKNYDNAFVSRIRYHIEFKLPDYEGRKKIWDKFLVRGIPLEEDRDVVIENCANCSDGLSGREIRNALRIAFPRALNDDKINKSIKFSHIESAVEDIKKANKNVGTNKKHYSEEKNAEISRRLLGVSD